MTAPRSSERAGGNGVPPARQEPPPARQADAAGAAQDQRPAAQAAAAAPAAIARPAGAVIAAARPGTVPNRPAQAPPLAASQTVQFRISPVAPPAAPPKPPRAGAAMGTFPVRRVVCWQLALVLVFLVIGWPWPMVGLTGIAATALVTVTAMGVRGRWLSEEWGLRLRLAFRRRRYQLPEQDSAGALVRLLAPGARIHTAELAGSTAGVVSHVEELVAVLRPLDCTPDALARMALTGGLLPDDDPATPTVRLRLVLHRSPRRPDTPAEQLRVWLAVGVGRDSDCPGDGDLAISLSNAVGRIRRRLRASGIDAVPLPDLELAATLTSLSHIGPGERNTVREQWRYWRAGPISQAGLRIRGLAAHPSTARIQLLYQLHAVPATEVAVTVALTCASEPDAVLRIASPTDTAVDAAAQALSWSAAMSGMQLIRMDGQHGHAVAASLPIGGNAR